LAVVIKGTSCAGAKRLGVHLTRTDTNERAEIKELRGVAAEDLRGALLEMEAVAAGTRSTKPFYHGSINTRAEERLTDEQRMHAIDRLEAALGLTGQARVVVVHEKEGREHCHIVWSRIDLERMAAISDSHNYRKHEEVARSLEREFGHERVQGAHVEREGRARPQRTPSHAEMLQADRTLLTPQEVKTQVTELWRNSENGRDFAVALWNAGYVLARGDRRDYVIIDSRGGTHSLARRIEGARVKDVRERMADLESDRLYGITDAKKIQGLRQARDAQMAPERSRPTAPQVEGPALETRREPTRGAPEPPAADVRIGHGIAKGIAAPLEGITSLFENLIAGEEHKPQTPDERIAAERDRQARLEAKAAEESLKAPAPSGIEKERQALLREFGRESQDELRHDREMHEGRGRRRGE
jgi:hypothetical protein